MSDPARQGLTAEQFYGWVLGLEARYELVDGAPVLMAGANRRHDRIVINAIYVLTGQLRGKPCQPFSSDTYVSIPNGNRRMPDLGVDCGAMADDSMAGDSMEAGEPRLVVEVMSPSTGAFDRTDKLEEYKTVSSMQYILLVDTDIAQVRLYWRDLLGVWATEKFVGQSAVLALPQLDVALTLAELYEGLSFRSRPTLVIPAAPLKEVEE